MWPGQITEALKGLIHAANLAPERAREQIPDGTLAMWTRSFRHGVRIRLTARQATNRLLPRLGRVCAPIEKPQVTPAGSILGTGRLELRYRNSVSRVDGMAPNSMEDPE